MKNNEFQQLVDHEFAALTWTDRQRLDTLQKMSRKEHSPMKHKTALACILVLVMTAMSAALAVTLNITSLAEFFSGKEHLSHLTLNEDAVVAPVGQRHTSRLMDVSVEQMYLTDETLYFTLHLTPKDDRTLLFPLGANSIIVDGQTVRYFDLWDTDLTLLQLGPMEIDDLNTRNPIETMAYPDFRREPDGSYTLLCSTIDEDTVRYFRTRKGGQLMLRFYIDDCRSRDREWNAVFIDMPAIVRQTP